MVCIEVQEGTSRTFDTTKVDWSCLLMDFIAQCTDGGLLFLAKSLKGQGIYRIKGADP
jgi:hypothetical protein